jgi:hypothetical protein
MKTEHINHGEYMAKTKTMMVAELRYTIEDATKAILANPEGHKAGYYADEINYCAMELKKRADMKVLVDAVRAHAMKHYERGGWDYVVECWEDKDIAAEIGGATTEGGAIRKVGKVAKVLGDYRAEVRAEIF